MNNLKFSYNPIQYFFFFIILLTNITYSQAVVENENRSSIQDLEFDCWNFYRYVKNNNNFDSNRFLVKNIEQVCKLIENYYGDIEDKSESIYFLQSRINLIAALANKEIDNPTKSYTYYQSAKSLFQGYDTGYIPGTNNQITPLVRNLEDWLDRFGSVIFNFTNFLITEKWQDVSFSMTEKKVASSSQNQKYINLALENIQDNLIQKIYSIKVALLPGNYQLTSDREFISNVEFEVEKNRIAIVNVNSKYWFNIVIIDSLGSTISLNDIDVIYDPQKSETRYMEFFNSSDINIYSDDEKLSKTKKIPFGLYAFFDSDDYEVKDKSRYIKFILQGSSWFKNHSQATKTVFLHDGQTYYLEVTKTNHPWWIKTLKWILPFY